MTGMPAAATLGVEHVAACPLCGSDRLVAHGVATDTSVALHVRQSRCADCGVLVSTPRVREHDRDAYYRERYYEQQWPDADRVLRENLATHAAHDVALIERIAGRHLSPGHRALDIGSGYGATVKTLRQRGYRATGCEMSWRGCTFARAHGATMVRAKAPGLPFADSAFDLVTSAHVIEHVGNPHEFVCELARLTRPGGVLAIITDHLAASQHTWNRVRSRVARRVPPFQTSTDHTFVFGTAHLRQLLERAGCSVIDIAVYHHAPPSESWHWRLYKSSFRLVDRMLGWGPYQLAVAVRVA